MPAEVSTPLSSLIAGFGIGAVVAGAIAIAILKFYIPSYLAEKGKNLATREDIAGITHEVERVKSQYTALTEELKARHQLRLAAIDRRLQAHQEAFALWRRLFFAVHTTSVPGVVMECEEWWEKNCLYLEMPVREAFLNAFMGAGVHASLLGERADAALVQSNWTRIIAFPDILFGAIQLPGLSDLEAGALKLNDPPPGATGGSSL